MSLAWQLAWRFRSSKHENGFISFISASSTIGIALGCFVLIVLLSVMNGFENQLKERLLQFIPHGELYAVDAAGMQDWQSILGRFESIPGLKHIEPYAQTTGMLKKGKQMKAVAITGLDLAYSQQSALIKTFDEAMLNAFSLQSNSILLGKGIMQKLNVSVGDSLQLMLPGASSELTLRAPKMVKVHVAGQISLGGEIDSVLSVVKLQFMTEHTQLETGALGLRFYFDDPFVAPSMMTDLGYEIPQRLYISSWQRTHGHLYEDIQLVRTVVYIALVLVIAVACFNIVSTLVMAVNEKQAEIAMLKSMGIQDALIMQVFVLQGAINGLMGVVAGTVLGVLTAHYLTDIAIFIEHLLGVRFLSSDIYFIDFLPSQIQGLDVLLTVIVALLLTVFATLYPARQAARIQPARALH